MHRVQLRPLFGDVDAMNVVYYGNYLRFFETGRCELMRSAGGSYARLAEEGMHLPVTEVGANYKKPALYDQLVTVETSVAWVKKASLQFDYRILATNDQGGEDVLVTGFTKHGCVNGQGKVVPLPQWAVSALSQHLPA